MTAGPNLNFVLGPNGTGKSAFVCGLILGLGGEATHTGRPGTLGEYIQFGKQKCSITVELFNENGENYVIERTLQHKQGPTQTNRESSVKSEWSLNGKKSKLQEIKELIGSLNIFTDNLCQFLPQEKVVEFVKLNKQQLLLNTEKAIGNIQMFEDHEQLIELSATEKKNREEICNLTKQFEKFDNLNQHYEAQVRVIRERLKTEERIKLFQMKKPWLEYEKARQEYNQLKARAVEIENKLKEKKNKLPFDRIIATKNKELKKVNDKLRDTSNDVNLTRQNDQIRTQLEKLKGNEKDEVYRYDMQFKKVKEQQIEIDKLTKELELLKNQLDSIEEVAPLREQIDLLDKEIKDHVENNTKRHDKKFELNREKRKIEEQIIQKKTLLKRETNVQDLRMDSLRQMDEKIYQITIWLEKNKHQFNNKIYPPMLLLLNAKKPEYIDLLETLIPKKDLTAFLVVDESDIVKFNDLINSVFRYRVSVITARNYDLSSLLNQRDDSLLNDFEMFASDIFTAPNEILVYLFSQAHLHLIPVSIRRSVRVEEVEKRNDNLKRCIANGKVYTFQRSEYDNEFIAEMRPVQRAKFLCGVLNEEKIKTYKREISELDLELNGFSSKYDEIDREFKAEQDCMNKDKDQMNSLTNKVNERSRLEHKIGTFTNKLKTVEEFKVDLDQEKENLIVKLKEFTIKRIQIIEAFKGKLDGISEYETKKLYEKCKELQLKKQIVYVQQLSKRYEETFKQYEDELKKSKERQKDMKAKADQLFAEAHRATGTNKNTNLPKSLMKKFDEIPNTLEELNSEIRKLELTLVFSNNEGFSDDTTRLYNENKEQLIKTRESLNSLNREQSFIVEKKEELKVNWINEITGLIDKISDKFHQFMRTLNFDGCVKLYKSEDENDYEKYGISVFVKYRDEEEIAELDYNTHSGGERSVATMIYIIALQKLAVVPFRVVDEINQVNFF